MCVLLVSGNVSKAPISKTRQIGEVDVVTAKWNTLGSIPEKFANHTIYNVTAFSSNIYVVFENDTGSEIQVYNPSCNSWRDFPILTDFNIKTIRCPVRLPRSLLSSALPSDARTKESLGGLSFSVPHPSARLFAPSANRPRIF